jgi:hypothetical protein
MGKRRNWIDETIQPGGLPLHLRNVMSLIKHVLAITAVTLATPNLTYASHHHSSAECYFKGHRIYVPDGFDYPREAWPSWGISCRAPKPGIAVGSGGTVAESGERPVEWCGWWMRQHLGGRYGPEFNVARNWLNAGRPLDGPRPGAIGVKAHHVFQVVRVVDPGHVLAISGNDHNAVRTRMRPTSDVIGWRDVTEESTTADEATDKHPTLQQPGAGMTAMKADQIATRHFAIKDTVGNCSVIDVQPSWASGMQLLGNKNGYSSVKDAQAALGSDCKGKIDRG